MLTLEERFWPKVDKDGDCWLWTAARNRMGYGKFGAGGRGAGWIGAHRVSWELANGPIPEGNFVCHHCDNPPCVRPDHLFLGDHRINGQDMSSKGRGVFQKHPERAARGKRNGAYTHPELVTRGEAHATSKLTDKQVLQIRAAYAAGARIAQIARVFGVSWSNVKFIVTDHHWRHVE